MDFLKRTSGLGGRWPYYAPSPLRGACFAKASQPEGAEDMSKGWSKVRRCGSDSEVVGWVDVAIRDFVDGDRGSGGLGTKLADF